MNAPILNIFNQITVPFYEAQLSIISLDGQPYIPMRPIVQSIGLDWKSQHSKIKNRFSNCVVEITIQLLGDTQSRQHTCLPLHKLFGWLMTINSNKVKPELKEKVIRYQTECDDVLFNYWKAKLQLIKRGVDEFNQIKYIDKCSKQRGSISSYGLLDRKREKKIIQQLEQAWIAEYAQQLNLDFINNDMEDK